MKRFETYEEWKAEYVRIGGWDEYEAKKLRDSALRDYFEMGTSPGQAYDEERAEDDGDDSDA